MKDNLFIIIPVYNEEECVRSVVNEWTTIVNKIGNNSKLMILNDGSTDNSLQILLDIKKNNKNLVIIDKKNSGHGPTCFKGYLSALKDADWIFQTDSDGQTSPEEFWKFWENRGKYNFLIGYRKFRGDGIIRLIISRMLSFSIFLIFHVWVKDSNVPFRLMRSEKLSKYLNKIPSDFFLSNSLLTTLIIKDREKVKWIPITFKPRQGGCPSVRFSRFITLGIKVIKDFRRFKRGC